MAAGVTVRPMEDNLEDEVAMAAMTGTVELTARFCTIFRSKKVV